MNSLPPSLPLCLTHRQPACRCRPASQRRVDQPARADPPQAARHCGMSTLQHSTLPAQIWHTPTKYLSLLWPMRAFPPQPDAVVQQSHTMLLLPLRCCSCSERAGWWGPSGGAESKLSPWYGPDRNRVRLAGQHSMTGGTPRLLGSTSLTRPAANIARRAQPATCILSRGVSAATHCNKRVHSHASAAPACVLTLPLLCLCVLCSPVSLDHSSLVSEWVGGCVKIGVQKRCISSAPAVGMDTRTCTHVACLVLSCLDPTCPHTCTPDAPCAIPPCVCVSLPPGPLSGEPPAYLTGEFPGGMCGRKEGRGGATACLETQQLPGPACVADPASCVVPARTHSIARALLSSLFADCCRLLPDCCCVADCCCCQTMAGTLLACLLTPSPSGATGSWRSSTHVGQCWVSAQHGAGCVDWMAGLLSMLEGACNGKRGQQWQGWGLLAGSGRGVLWGH